MSVRHRTGGEGKQGPLAAARRPGAGCAASSRGAPLAAWAWRSLLGLLLVALAANRAAAYQPATLSQFDANVYVWQAQGGLFDGAACRRRGIRDSCGWRTCSATRSR